jgi:hypothetical protein
LLITLSSSSASASLSRSITPISGMLLRPLKELLGGLGRHRTSGGRTATVAHDQPSLRTETLLLGPPTLEGRIGRECELLHTSLRHTSLVAKKCKVANKQGHEAKPMSLAQNENPAEG